MNVEFEFESKKVKPVLKYNDRESIVSYMEKPPSTGQQSVTDASGFQGYTPLDNYFGIFLLPLAKYKPRG